MKRFIITFCIIILLPTIVLAAEDEYYDYLSSFDLSSFEQLDDETISFLDELGIKDFDYNALSHLSFANVLKHIGYMVLDRLDNPLKSTVTVICFIIITSFLKSLNNEMNSSEMTSLYSTVSSLAISIFLVVKITDCIMLSCSTIKICANFSFAFFPAFCIIVATSGGPTTSFSVNTMLLSLAQGLNYITDLVFIPIVNCFLALGICSSIRDELNINSITEALKRCITGAISVVSAIFVSVLSIKTTVAARADALGIRSVRFAINSVVPIIGGTISEGLLSIQNYSSLIKSSVGVVGIIAVSLIFLPALIEVNLWRATLSLSSMCADIFCDKASVTAIRAFGNTLLIVDVILILSMVTTIISLGILVAAKTVV